MKIRLSLALFVIAFAWSGNVAQNLPSYSVTALDPQSSGYYFFVPIKIGSGSLAKGIYFLKVNGITKKIIKE